jgi:hypothetical protein
VLPDAVPDGNLLHPESFAQQVQGKHLGVVVVVDDLRLRRRLPSEILRRARSVSSAVKAWFPSRR